MVPGYLDSLILHLAVRSDGLEGPYLTPLIFFPHVASQPLLGHPGFPTWWFQDALLEGGPKEKWQSFLRPRLRIDTMLYLPYHVGQSKHKVSLDSKGVETDTTSLQEKLKNIKAMLFNLPHTVNSNPCEV